MASLIVDGLDKELMDRLRARAARHSRSSEAELREILRSALSEASIGVGVATTATRLAQFRERTATRDAPTSATLLRESRQARTDALLKGRAP